MSGGDWKDMFKAIQDGNIAFVQYYLKIGIDPNYQHPEILASPLVESIRFDNLEIAKLILEHGGDPKIKEVWGGEIPMSVAKEKKNQEAIDLLNSFM